MFFAAYGWQHDAWQDRFYPDDLPSDWRLGYYANEFKAVVVPVADWQGLTGADFEAWRDDVGEEFRFFLELDATDPTCGVTEAAAALGEALGGFVTAGELSAAAAVTRPTGRPLGALGAPGMAVSADLTTLRCPNEAQSPRALRTLVEALAATAAGRPALLCCGSGPDTPDSLQKATTISELLGV